MTFAIKAEIHDPQAKAFTFTAQKTMYGGKHIAEGDVIFVFAEMRLGATGAASGDSPLPSGGRAIAYADCFHRHARHKLVMPGLAGFAKASPAERTRGPA